MPCSNNMEIEVPTINNITSNSDYSSPTYEHLTTTVNHPNFQETSSIVPCYEFTPVNDLPLALPNDILAPLPDFSDDSTNNMHIPPVLESLEPPSEFSDTIDPTNLGSFNTTNDSPTLDEIFKLKHQEM